MRKEQTLSKILGLTQEQIAMLLGIKRVRWALYESGKRRLPADKIEIYNQLLSYAQNESTISNRENQPNILDEATKKFYYDRMRDNKLQTIIVKKRIALLTKKRNASDLFVKLAHHLSDSGMNKKMQNPVVNAVATQKKTVEPSTPKELIELQYKLNLLHLESVFLESKLEKL